MRCKFRSLYHDQKMHKITLHYCLVSQKFIFMKQYGLENIILANAFNCNLLEKQIERIDHVTIT
jgi:hypothetical protein